MDVRFMGAIAVVVACCICGHVASQPVAATENVTSDPSKGCLTPRNVSGQCVHRQSCDHGTPAIDQTLYAPHGYIRPCAMDEVCCPMSDIAQVEMNTIASMDFDVDDV